MTDEAYEVSSELFEERDYSSKSKPRVNQKNVVSQFHFQLPAYGIRDKQGDIIVPRTKGQSEFLEIEHSCSTVLDLVGLQIWRGSLLLADWLLCNGGVFLEGECILELGSGVGLASIVASMFNPVICTDINRGDIFPIIRANVERNRHLTNHPVEVLELDFMAETLPEKIASILPKVSTVIAADVVYDDRLTEAFVKTMQKLLDIPPKRTVMVALEKRYVFTIRDRDTSAPCYDYFLDSLKTLKNAKFEEVSTDFAQYFSYDRCKELVLWKITSEEINK